MDRKMILNDDYKIGKEEKQEEPDAPIQRIAM